MWKENSSLNKSSVYTSKWVLGILMISWQRSSTTETYSHAWKTVYAVSSWRSHQSHIERSHISTVSLSAQWFNIWKVNSGKNLLSQLKNLKIIKWGCLNKAWEVRRKIRKTNKRSRLVSNTRECTTLGEETNCKRNFCETYFCD